MNIRQHMQYLTGTVQGAIGYALYIPLSISSYLLGNKKAAKEVKEKGKGKKDVLYAFECSNCDCCVSGIRKGYKTFKVGKTFDLEQRMKPYRTIYPQGKVFHTVICDDMHHAEKILHQILKMKGYHVKQEIFCLPPAVLKNCMDMVSALEKAVRNDKVDIGKITKDLQKWL